MMRYTALGLLLLAAPVAAQRPPDDPRIVAITARTQGLIHLVTSPEVTQTLLFARGERIESVILSDPTAYFVNVSGTGDSLALRAAGASYPAIMTVRTSRASYEFDLVTAMAGQAAPVLRLVPEGLPPVSRSLAPPVMNEKSVWRISGNRTLQPASVSDDGVRTYIRWAEDQALPATFGLGPTGDEQMVDGYMRGGIFTIDRLYDTLVFRIDGEQAKAERQIPEATGKRQKDRESRSGRKGNVNRGGRHSG